MTIAKLGSVHLTELIDIDELQELQDAFARSSQVASTITDIHGTPITRPSNHSVVCELIRSTPLGLARCTQSGQALGERSRESMHPNYEPCMGIGFIDASAPIVVRGHHLANWIIGQNYVGDVDESRVRAYADEIGLDSEPLTRAFAAMPKLSRENFERKLDFLWRMAGQISTLGYNNYRLEQMVGQLRKKQRELRLYKNQLEGLVETRTLELRQAISQIKRLSITDALTRCYNRRFINDMLPREIMRASRYGRALSVILCDIDRFKRINDRRGHQCGDRVLAAFADLINAGIRRDTDWCARYGGEEFLVVMPETDSENAIQAAQRLRDAVRRLRIPWEDHEIAITASFGVACLPDGRSGTAVSAETLINAADMALYQAKDTGRDRVIAAEALSIRKIA